VRRCGATTSHGVDHDQRVARDIYAVVTDFEHYADWVSDLKRIEVLTRDDQGRGLEVEFRAAAFGRSTTYTLPLRIRQSAG